MRRTVFFIGALFLMSAEVRAESGLIKTIATKAEFLTALASGNNQVFVFTATWCPACMGMKPLIERMARLFAGKIKFFTLDYDNHLLSELFDTYVVNGIPTFMFSDECSQTFLLHEGTFEDKKFEQALNRLVQQSCQKNAPQKSSNKQN